LFFFFLCLPTLHPQQPRRFAEPSPITASL
jgi:hypothetical protein